MLFHPHAIFILKVIIPIYVKILKMKQLFSSTHHIHVQEIKCNFFFVQMPHSSLRVLSQLMLISWKWNNYFHPHITFILKTWKMQYVFSSTCMPHSCFKGIIILSQCMLKSWKWNNYFHPHLSSRHENAICFFIHMHATFML